MIKLDTINEIRQCIRLIGSAVTALIIRAVTQQAALYALGSTTLKL